MPRLNWIQILATAVVTGIVTVATGLILSKIQAREPGLRYSSVETIPFQGEEEVTAIYQVSVWNEGKREVEDIRCNIQILGGTITDSRILAAPSMIYQSVIGNQGLDFTLNLLNPSEAVQILILAKGRLYLPSKPEVSVRAKGVIGQQESAPSNVRDTKGLLPSALVMSAAGLLAGLFTLRLIRRHLTSDTELEGHSSDQRFILAYLATIHGLEAEAEKYTSHTGSLTYWFESDRLTKLTIANGDKTHMECVLGMFNELLDYASVHKESAAIILLNCAKICQAKGSLDEASKYINKARRLHSKITELRLRIDPSLKAVVASDKSEINT